MSKGSSHNYGFIAKKKNLGRISRHHHIVRFLGFYLTTRLTIQFRNICQTKAQLRFFMAIIKKKKKCYLHQDTRYQIVREIAKEKICPASGICLSSLTIGGSTSQWDLPTMTEGKHIPDAGYIFPCQGPLLYALDLTNKLDWSSLSLV